LPHRRALLEIVIVDNVLETLYEANLLLVGVRVAVRAINAF